jgi:hypothetical protein
MPIVVRPSGVVLLLASPGPDALMKRTSDAPLGTPMSFDEGPAHYQQLNEHDRVPLGAHATGGDTPGDGLFTTGVKVSGKAIRTPTLPQLPRHR